MSTIIVGIDEVGRGALAGPIMACAAMFADDRCPVPGVQDSKLFGSGARARIGREKVFKELMKSPIVDIGIGTLDEDFIDSQGIEIANQAAFQQALRNLRNRFCIDLLLVDGERFSPGWVWGHQRHPTVKCEPKADKNYWQVGAASVIAKVVRDRLMDQLAEKYPEYDWKNNAGYGSEKHRDAIVAHGVTPYHRRSFLRKFSDLTERLP